MHENYELRFGITNMKKHPFFQRKISQIIVHPDFKSVKTGFDIALIKMDHSIHFQHNIMPICLPDTKEEFSGMQ
jgi:hypothetical protein